MQLIDTWHDFDMETLAEFFQKLTLGWTAFVGLVGGLTFSKWMAIASLCIALVGLGITWFYRHESIKLQRKAYELSIAESLKSREP